MTVIMTNHKYLPQVNHVHKPTKVKCNDLENTGYCKWQLLAPINQYNRNLMKVGPIPGDIDEATFFAFYYEARDVLCLGTLSN